MIKYHCHILGSIRFLIITSMVEGENKRKTINGMGVFCLTKFSDNYIMDS